jgi:lipopolysaccharide transport system permease protein
MPSSAVDSLPAKSSLPQATAPSTDGPRLPDVPLVAIEPTRRFAIDARALWSYRELLYFFVWRDLKVRYKQTVLGVAWVVLQPVLMTLVFTVFLGKLARVPSDGVPYALFVFGGMLPWIFVSGSVVGSANSMVGNANLITKTYFPRVIIPASVICGRLVDFFVSLVVFAVMLVVYNVHFTRNLLILPLVMILMATLALAIGMWTAAVNVKYRDVSAVLPVLVQFWMFTSPVVYPSSLVQDQNLPAVFRLVYNLNPMVGIIENFRAALIGTPVNWWSFGVTTILTLALLIYAFYVFKKLETTFADII